MRLTFVILAGLIGLGPNLALVASPAGADTDPASRSGHFQDADRSHQGAGIATLVQGDDGSTLLRFAEFSVTPGPDLEVWLVVDPTPNTSAAVLASEWLSLGALQSPEGAQDYALPANVDPAAYGSVVIWCEDFSVLFAMAPLN